MTWQHFVIEYGYRACLHHLAHVVGQSVADVARVRSGGHKCRSGKRRQFPELFARWRGRPPRENEWPTPRRHGGFEYEWQGPELALLASLVGHVDAATIARTLTERLRKLTGDPSAERTHTSIVNHAHALGLATNDVRAGFSTSAAAKRAGVTPNLIHQEVSRGKLRHFRMGRLIVIPARALDEWKAQRLPDSPKGWVKLWSIRKRLGVNTDHLAYHAKHGRIPGALFCAGHRYWVSPAVAADLIRRRQEGKPMPWHGWVHPSVARRSFDLWQRRRHRDCAECHAIWRPVGGEPRTFDEFYPRWLKIPEATKRHLTIPDGLSLTSAAVRTGHDRHVLTEAIRAGLLRARREGPRWVVTYADLARWNRRRGHLGSVRRLVASREVLTFKDAAHRAGLSQAQLRRAVARGELKVVRRRRDGRPGLRRVDVGALRAKIGGLTIREAALRAEISVAAFRRHALARGWKPGAYINQQLVEWVKSRIRAPWQLSISVAAKRLRRPVAWVRRAIDAGVLRPLRGVDRRRKVVGRKAVYALIRRGVPDLPPVRRGRPVVWMHLVEAAAHAGVTVSTIKRWLSLGKLKTETRVDGVHYAKSSVESAAREYWRTCKWKRYQPPAWLQAEKGETAA